MRYFALTWNLIRLIAAKVRRYLLDCLMFVLYECMYMCDYWMLDWSTHVNTFLTYKKKQLNAILWHKHILTAAHIWRENNWKTRKKPRARLKTFFLMYFPIKHHNECVDDWRRRWWRQLRRRLRLRHSNDDEQDNVHKRYMPTSFSHCSATDFYILTLFPQITSAHILFDCTQLSAQMEKKMHSPDFPRTHIFFWRLRRKKDLFVRMP